MAKYTVSTDLLIPVVVEIEAESPEAAEEELFEMNKRGELVKLADTSDPMILEGSIDISSEEN